MRGEERRGEERRGEERKEGRGGEGRGAERRGGEGRGEGKGRKEKNLCDLTRVFMQDNGEICVHFTFFSRSFVHHCS